MLICDNCGDGSFEVKSCLLKIPISDDEPQPATRAVLTELKVDLCTKCRDDLRDEINKKSVKDYIKQNLLGIKDK